MLEASDAKIVRSGEGGSEEVASVEQVTVYTLACTGVEKVHLLAAYRIFRNPLRSLFKPRLKLDEMFQRLVALARRVGLVRMASQGRGL